MAYLVILFLFLTSAPIPDLSWARNNFIIGGNTAVDASGKGVSKWEIRNSSGALISTGNTDTERIGHARCAFRTETSSSLAGTMYKTQGNRYNPPIA